MCGPAVAFVTLLLLAGPAGAFERRVAVTFDDLPGAAASMAGNDVPTVRP